MTGEIRCANCGNTFQGFYCNSCGQKVIDRFTLNYVWQTIRTDLIGIEGGLIHTFKELWKRPGPMINSYLHGVTKPYYSPIKYLIFWTAIYLLIVSLLERTNQQLSLGSSFMWRSGEPFSSESFQNFRIFMEWSMKQNTNFYMIGILPFLSLVGLLFIRRNNFTEIIIFFTYYGQFSFCASVANLMFLFSDTYGAVLSTSLIFVSYFFLLFRMLKQFIEVEWATAILKGMAISLFGTSIYWLLAFLVFNGLKYFLHS